MKLSASGLKSRARVSTGCLAGVGIHGSTTRRPHSSSFLGIPYRILNRNPKKPHGRAWAPWIPGAF